MYYNNGPIEPGLPGCFYCPWTPQYLLGISDDSSNASLLSGDLATRIAGRYIRLSVYPLSLYEFRELLTAIHGNREEPKELFRRYIRYGASFFRELENRKRHKYDP